MTVKPIWESRKRPRFRKPHGAHVRKTKRGPQVRTIKDVAEIVRARQYFYLRDQAVHPAVLACMQLSYILRLLDEESLYRALDIETGEAYVSKNTWHDYQG